MFQTPKLIFNKAYDIISTDADFSYFTTKERGLVIVNKDMLSPTLYPYIFVDYGNITEISVERAPKVWKYHFSLKVVVLTLADRGNLNELVFQADGGNTMPGVGDMVEDVCDAFWKYHDCHFTLDDVTDWTIGGVFDPDAMYLQYLVANELMKGKQVMLDFHVTERQS